MGRMKSVGTITKNLKKALTGYNKGQDITSYEKYIYLILFYRFLSESIIKHIQTSFNVNYIELNNNEAEAYKSQVQSDIDFFIYPEDLFQNIVAKELNSSRLDSTLNSIFKNIKQSSKYEICEIFRNIDTEAEGIGTSQNIRSNIYSTILKAISDVDYDINKSDYDLFGNIFEFLLNNKDTNNTMSLKNGIFYTQPSVVKLLKKISDQYITDPNNIYDPTCGSGSLLTEYARFNNTIPFYGKELNAIPAMLCRMNMIIHNVRDFKISQCDTLLTYDKEEKEKYDLIFANPPFGIPWNKSALREDDERFNDKPLPNKELADWAFIYHIIYTLNKNGLALAIDTPNMLSRSNPEETAVKKHLVDSNQIDTIILLPRKMFLRTDTGTCLFLIRKNKTDNNILFVDAGNICTKNSNQVTFSDENIDNIIELILGRKSIDNLSYLATPEEIANHKYSLNICDYINYKKEHTFTTIEDVCLSDFIYENEEEANYKSRLKYNTQIKRVNECIVNTLEQLKQSNQIKMIPLANVADITIGSKIKDMKIDTNDNFPYRYITTKEIQNGVVIEDHPVMYIKENKSIHTERIRKEDLDEFISKGKLEKDDVLFAIYSKGTKAAIVDEPNFIFSDGVNRLRPFKDIEDEVTPAYLRYVLESDYFVEKINKHIKRYYNNTSSPTNYTTLEDFRQLTIPVIPLDAQIDICLLLALMEAKYTELEIALKRELEVYQYRYHTNTKKLFNDVETVEEDEEN
ncbi:MAG: N-6 DNA methylase [Bacilli bacterium]|nr:N-6 DNA methylase [Bacilli bacterium]